MLLPIAQCAARAGGGSHSGGGGGHSGGGHSSGGHSFGGTPVIDTGSGGGPGVGAILVLILLVLIIWILYRRFIRDADNDRPGGGPTAGPGAGLGAGLGAAATGIPSTASHSPLAVESGAPPAGLAAIAGADPGFEIESFLQRAEMTFFLVKRALQKNDPVALRPYLGDAVYAPLAHMITQNRAAHRHALLESLNVRAVHVAGAQVGVTEQQVEVHFDLVYRAKTVDDSQHVLADEGADTRHGERWTFTRAATAKTPATGGVTAARCPACGAELRLSLEGQCTHCRASVTNGSVDWTVSAVRPAPFVGYAPDAGYVVAAPTVAEGIARLKAADPAFTPEAFAARVRTAFLALQKAWCEQNLEAGRAFLSPGAYFAWSAQLETLASEGRRNVMEHLTITSVSPLRVVHGRVYDDLTVRIGASCADYEVDASGALVFGHRAIEPFSEDWTFQRSVGVVTSGKPGTLEQTCPSCGAPVALTQIGECRYCKAAVTSGKFDWVVSRIEQVDDAGSGNDGDDDDRGSLTAAVGGAIVGGLLGGLLSND